MKHRVVSFFADAIVKIDRYRSAVSDHGEKDGSAGGCRQQTDGAGAGQSFRRRRSE